MCVTKKKKKNPLRNEILLLTFFLIWSKNQQLLKSSAWNRGFPVRSQSSLCACVMSERVVKLEDGPAVCFHSRQIGEVFLTWWREAAYRLSHCVTHWRRLRLFFFFFSFPQTPTYQFCSSGESGCLFSNIALRICQGYSPKLLFRNWKNEMVMLIMLGGGLWLIIFHCNERRVFHLFSSFKHTFAVFLNRLSGSAESAVA